MSLYIRLILAVVLTGALSGCAIFTRTVYVPDGKAIRLRQKVSNVKVWVKEVGGNTAEGRLDLPEGWYCLPMKEDGK